MLLPSGTPPFWQRVGDLTITVAIFGFVQKKRKMDLIIEVVFGGDGIYGRSYHY